MAEDKKARDAVEHVEKPAKVKNDTPAAGPHAKKHLTDEDKTPGTGSLPDAGSKETGAGTG